MKATAMATQTREQVLEKWVQATGDFYSCYQLLTQHQHLITNFPKSQIAQVKEDMHRELICLTNEASQLDSVHRLISHTKRLQKLTRKAKAILWLAGITIN